MTSEIALISDVDVLHTNPEKVAAALADYIKGAGYNNLQPKKNKVTCICRVKSEVGFGFNY